MWREIQSLFKYMYMGGVCGLPVNEHACCLRNCWREEIDRETIVERKRQADKLLEKERD